MTNPESPRSITAEDFDRLLHARWEQIALFAFEQFAANGRGAVFLDRYGLEDDILLNQVDLGFAVYESNSLDTDTVRMINEYDPDWEIVFQYLRPVGKIGTARIRTAPDNRHPWRIYLFDRLMKDEKQ